MDLSIIIVNFNTKHLLLRCIQSIVLSKPNLSYEIIVVDNGSTDGSKEMLSELSVQKPNFKVVFNQQNLGFARANNIGMERAESEYNLLLNSDTEIRNDALGTLFNFAKTTSDAGVVGAKLLNVGGDVQPSVFRLPTLARAIRQYWLGEKGLLDKYAPENVEPVEVEAVVGAAFLITPQAIKTVGKLDERYFMYFEDLDYCRQVRLAGLKIYYLPAAEITHLHGASGEQIAKPEDQWKRLVPSSKIYHGILKHYLINFIIRTGRR